MKKLVKYFLITFFVSIIVFSFLLLIALLLKMNSNNENIIEPSKEITTETKLNATVENIENSTLQNTENTTETTISDVIESNTDKNNTNNINISFTGDVYFSEIIQTILSNKGIDAVISKDIQNLFINSDITMVNQEFPFSSNGQPMENKQFTFRVKESFTHFLKDMDIDIVTLANNHTLDYGVIALEDTLKSLTNNEISYVGAGNNISEARKSSVFNINNKKIAILGSSRVIPVADWNASKDRAGLSTTYDPTNLLIDIKEAKLANDFVIVYVHWGIERNEYPEEYQRSLAKQYIDAGADIIIGSHPHVLQGIEFYKNKPIIYSLGNFIFYNSISKTAVLNFEIDSNNEIIPRIIPCYTENGLTDFVKDDKKIKDFLEYIKTISYNIDVDSFGYIHQKVD